MDPINAAALADAAWLAAVNANFKLAATITTSKVAGPWLKSLLQKTPNNLKELIKVTHKVYLLSNAPIKSQSKDPPGGNLLFDWVSTYAKVYVPRYVAQVATGIYNPFLELGVKTWNDLYELAPIKAEIFYRDLEVNPCTVPLHLFDQNKIRIMWLMVYEEAISGIYGNPKEPNSPDIYRRDLFPKEIEEIYGNLRTPVGTTGTGTKGGSLVKKWFINNKSMGRRCGGNRRSDGTDKV